MSTIKELRAQAEKALDQQDALVARASAEGRGLTEAEQTEYDGHTAAYDKAMADIAELEARNARREKLATVGAGNTGPRPVDATGLVSDVTGKADPVRVEVNDALQPTQKIGLYAWCSAFNREKGIQGQDPYAPLEAVGYTKLADAGRAHAKARLDALPTAQKALLSISGAGANTVFTPLDSEFIEFLRNASAFLAGNPVRIDMPLGSLDIAAGNAPTSGTYLAEGADSVYTEMTTRQVSLAAKHLKAHTAANNFLIETSPLAVATIMGDDLAQSLTTSLDAAGLRGDGTGANPTGIRSLTAAAHVVAAAATGATPTLAAVTADLRDCMQRMRSSNVPMRRWAWVMSSRTLTFLEYILDGNGNRAFPEVRDMKLGKYPIIMSEQVPSNLGVGTDESEIYLIDYGHVLFGVSRELRLTASQEASYKNSGGTLVSAFNLDETVIRGIASHDFDMRHDKAASIITAVQWGS